VQQNPESPTAGAAVELPGMPGAAQDLPFAAIGVVAGAVAFDQAGQHAGRKAAAAMRAAVVDREVFSLDVDDDDGAFAGPDQSSRAGRQVTDGGEDMLCHHAPRAKR
jgi:hypothetical protein